MSTDCRYSSRWDSIIELILRDCTHKWYNLILCGATKPFKLNQNIHSFGGGSAPVKSENENENKKSSNAKWVYFDLNRVDMCDKPPSTAPPSRTYISLENVRLTVSWDSNFVIATTRMSIEHNSFNILSLVHAVCTLYRVLYTNALEKRTRAWSGRSGAEEWIFNLNRFRTQTCWREIITNLEVGIDSLCLPRSLNYPDNHRFYSTVFPWRICS